MNDTDERTEQFVALFVEHREEVFRFILSILPHQADAEDVFQRTSVVLWRKFSDFTPGTSFFRWAARVAQLEVLDYCKKKGRDRIGFWSTELVEAIADTREQQEEILVNQRQALSDCLARLRPPDRQLVELRYTTKTSSKALAESMGRPAVTVYKSLARIRRWLYECIERKLAPDQRG
jgi:RNA polymerase sigma-70 factor (ECF subfamily)